MSDASDNGDKNLKSVAGRRDVLALSMAVAAFGLVTGSVGSALAQTRAGSGGQAGSTRTSSGRIFLKRNPDSLYLKYDSGRRSGPVGANAPAGSGGPRRRR
ncbi:MAG: hypothetical protein ACK4M0_04400 [Phreatobacter sp.]